MPSGHWFDSGVVDSAVSLLASHLHVPAEQSGETPEQQKAEMIRNVLLATGGMVLFLGLVIGALVLFAEPEDPDKPLGLSAYLLPVLLVAGAGVAAMLMTEQSQANRRGTDLAFSQIAQRIKGMIAIGGTQLTGDDVGIVPWFQTEESMTDLQWNVRIHLGGQYGDHKLAYVECSHVVDPMANMTALGRTVGTLGIGRQKRLQLRGMDAVVFLERLPDLSDLLVVPRLDGGSGAYYQLLAKSAHDIQTTGMIPKSIARKYWSVTSEIGGYDQFFQPPLANLLDKRKWCILQVLDGYCVVIAGRRPKSAFYQGSRKEKQILGDLEFAMQVFAQLKAYAEGSQQATSVGMAPATGIAPAMPSRPSVPLSPAAVPEPVPAPVSTDQPQSPFAPQTSLGPQHPTPAAMAPTATATAPMAVEAAPGSSCLGIIGRLISAGIGAVLMLGGVVGACMYGIDLFWGPQSEKWPTVQGTIIESSFEERGAGDSMTYRPKFEYAYVHQGQQHSGERIQFGFRRTEELAEAEEIERAYPQGAEVEVRVNPKMPSVATLRTGIYKHDFSVTGLCFGLFLVFVSLIFLWLAVRRGKRKLAAV